MADPGKSYIPLTPPPNHGITDEALDEFIAIYKEEFKEDISRVEALGMVSRLLRLYAVLSRKLPGDKT